MMRKSAPKPAKQKKDFDSQNEMAARLILEKPWMFGGEGSFCVIWARLFQRRADLQRKITKRSNAA